MKSQQGCLASYRSAVKCSPRVDFASYLEFVRILHAGLIILVLLPEACNGDRWVSKVPIDPI